jgi:phosphopantothenoylcysteine decarboxylase/phosphopantothenate--cysteine ligase
MSIELVRTQDILKELGTSKRPDQLLMGFAAETQQFEDNAKEKLARKHLDMIALNDVSRPGEGFGADSNNIKLFFSDGTQEDLGSADKRTLAKEIMARVAQRYRTL